MTFFAPSVFSVFRGFSVAMLAVVLAIAFGVDQAASALHPDVERIIQQQVEPSGVVIEVESLSPNAMSENVTFIQAQVDALKAQYPNLDVVIVSHGRELVELAKPEVSPQLGSASSPSQPSFLSAFENMSTNQGVTVHVCAVVAGWEGKSDQDFASFVDVSASGEAQINDYRALGYEVVIIERLSDEDRKSLQPVAD